MTVFRDNCPFCGTKSVAFTIVAESVASKVSPYDWHSLAICGQCSRGVLTVFETPERSPPRDLLERGHNLDKRWIFPEPPKTEAPEHTPKNVANYYRQGMENLGRNWDAAGTMFRKALDVGLKVKFSHDTKGKLYERIRRAADRHDLTPELADWAHQIRLDGNDAAHDEEPLLEPEARRLQVFTELVFRYLFTLPGMMQEARQDETSAENQE